MTAGHFQHFYAPDTEHVTIAEFLDLVRINPLRDGRNVPACIWGSRGIGKTQQVKAYADARGMGFVTYHPAHDVSGQDIVGKSEISKDGKLIYAKPDFLPDADDQGEGIWFIDEINRGNDAVLAGLMEPLGEGTISQSGWEIPKGWMIVVAANPYTTQYQVRPLDSAMVGRMLHYNPGWNPAQWAAWATRQGLSQDVIDFALKYPDLMSSGSGKGEFQIPDEIEKKIEANPRSTEYFEAMYSPDMPERLVRVLGYGLLGRRATQQFIESRADQSGHLLSSEILSEPIEVQENVNVYSYDERLELWKAQGDETYGRMVIGSAQMLAAALINLPDPTGKTLADAREAQLAARFVARLASTERSKALEILQRSCPNWMPLIVEGVDLWTGHLARTNQLLPG